MSIIDNQFVPSEIDIEVCDTVRWTNNGALPHTATSDEGPGSVFDSRSEFPAPDYMQLILFSDMWS